MTTAVTRSYNRAPDGLRPTTIERDFVKPATGSALITQGETRVICTASIQESVPRWMAGRGRGWATAEYGMLPASTGERKPRDVSKGRPDGRTIEIQRLIGRSLRGIVEAARRYSSEAIVIGGEPPTKIKGGARLGGIGAAKPAEIGAATEYVLKKAPCRVLLTAPPETAPEPAVAD